MERFDVEAIVRSLPEDAPCGPDLEAEGDLGYLNLMARIEGSLPESYFGFDRANVDLRSDRAALSGLLERSLDLRPMVALAKLAILDRDLDDFVGWLTATDTLLSRFWTHVHPGVADGTALRAAVLQTLDDLPTVILPLQYVPLASGRRSGTISFRHHLAASGEVARRPGEAELDAGAIEQVMMEAEIGELIAVRDTLARLTSAVDGIRKAWIREAGSDDPPSLDRLGRLSSRMLAFVAEPLGRRAPEAVGGPTLPETDDSDAETAPATPTMGGTFHVGSVAAASAALSGVVSYLADHEPSNPALMLVCQAQQLVGRSFVEIMRLVMPDALKDARITVGMEQQLVFKLDQLPEITFASEGATQDGGASDASTSAAPGPTVRSRREAQILLDHVAAFYRAAEPSNPIPLFCERARAMCSADFSDLLKEMLPKKK